MSDCVSETLGYGREFMGRNGKMGNNSRHDALKGDNRIEENRLLITNATYVAVYPPSTIRSIPVV